MSTDPETIIADNQRAYTEVTGRLIAHRDQLTADRAELVRMLERYDEELGPHATYVEYDCPDGVPIERGYKCALCGAIGDPIPHAPTCLIAEANALIERMKGSQ